MNRRAPAAAALVALLLGAAPAPAQEEKGQVQLTGFQYFLNILKLHNVQALAGPDDLAGVDPRETVIIVFGEPRGLDRVVEATGGLRRFRDAGGAVLIASDRRERDLIADLGVMIDGAAVEVSPPALADNPKLAYRGVPVMPVIDDALARHPVFKGLSKPLATNEPTFLRYAPGTQLRALAAFPDGCWLPRFGRGIGGASFIAGTPDGLPGGRVLIVAGHGMFMNHMMGRGDVDNARFAANCVEWLTDGGRRKHALFLESGSVASTFDVPLAQVPVPSSKAIAAMIRWLENKNFFNRLALDNLGRDTILRPLAVAVSLALALFALYRLVRAHHGGEPAPPPVAVKVAEEASELPAVLQRQRFLLAEGNCYEAARELARLCFEGVGGEPRPAGPPRALRGGRKLQRQADRLWKLAYGEEPEPVSPAELASLSVMMARVRSALTSGAVSCEAAAPAGR